MIVTCKAGGTTRHCQYNVNGYCTAKVVNINENSVCSHLFIKGNFDSNAFMPIDNEYKDLTQIPMSEEEYVALEKQYIFAPNIESEIKVVHRRNKKRATPHIRRIARKNRNIKRD